MLNGQNHSRDAQRCVLVIRFVYGILDRDLCLAVGADAVDGVGHAGQCQQAGQAMRQHHRQRHKLRRFLAGVADHNALIARAECVRVGVVQRYIDRARDVGTLRVQPAVDLKRFRVIPDAAHNIPRDVEHIRLHSRADLARDHDMPAGGQRLARDTGGGVNGKAGVQDVIGNKVAQFVGVALGNGFGGIKLFHGRFSPFIM